MIRGRRRLTSMLAVALAVLLGLGTQTLLAPPSQAASSGQSIMILLDMSTSMSERDSTGRYKIEGAKMGIVSLLEALPATAEVGLMTYPGGGDDCGEPTAVRSVLPLGAGNLAGTVGALRHSGGNTPTALALRKAAEGMKARGGGTIVLVSDGEANCGEPPCPEAKRIAAEGGVALTVNTVGFNISAQGRSELECIADATGGTYTPVENGDQLGQELARNMRPMLELWSNFPAEVSVSAATAVVRAELRNTSAITASNVQVTLTPSGLDAFLPIPRPQMWLGNLGKDERRTVEWAIPVSQLLMGKKVSLKVRAAGANASSVQQEGIVHFVAPGEGESLVGPTSQFHGANSVLVLGDSYSAGDGAYRNKADYTDEACRRSGAAYGEALFPGKVTNLACSGAVMSGVTGPGQQLSQVSARLKEGDRFDLVFLTIGGNDIMFADIARNCLAHNVLSPFSKGAGALPFLNPCAADPNSITYKPQRTLLNAQTPLLRDVYQQIAKTFAAQGLDVPPIIVSPYPLMAPMDPQLRWWCHDPLDVGANISQVGYFLDLQRSLNGLVEEAVRQAHDEDGIPVYFAPSVELAFQPDNTMCGDPTYVVPLSLTNAIGRDADTPYHPNVAGHRAWALALARWSEQPGLQLQRGTKPPGRRTLPWVFELAPRTVIDPAKSFSWAGQGEVDVVVTGLTPGTPVSAVVQSNPAALGVAHADAQGRAVISGRLEPTLVPPGLHTLQVTMTPAGGETTVVESQLYVTRNAPYWIWGVLGLGVLLLITGLVHLRSLRRSVT